MTESPFEPPPSLDGPALWLGTEKVPFVTDESPSYLPLFVAGTTELSNLDIIATLVGPAGQDSGTYYGLLCDDCDKTWKRSDDEQAAIRSPTVQLGAPASLDKAEAYWLPVSGLPQGHYRLSVTIDDGQATESRQFELLEADFRVEGTVDGPFLTDSPDALKPGMPQLQTKQISEINVVRTGLPDTNSHLEASLWSGDGWVPVGTSSGSTIKLPNTVHGNVLYRVILRSDSPTETPAAYFWQLSPN